jgi:hypothetical protein
LESPAVFFANIFLQTSVTQTLIPCSKILISSCCVADRHLSVKLGLSIN